MKIAQLLVENDEGHREDWGRYGFVDLPSTGDKLTVDAQGKFGLLVIGVHHRPVARQDGKSTLGLGLPQASVLATIA